jgi:hypothetical protein
MDKKDITALRNILHEESTTYRGGGFFHVYPYDGVRPLTISKQLIKSRPNGANTPKDFGLSIQPHNITVSGEYNILHDLLTDNKWGLDFENYVIVRGLGAKYFVEFATELEDVVLATVDKDSRTRDDNSEKV